MAKVSTSEENAFKWVVTLFLAFLFIACLSASIDAQRHLGAQDDTAYWEPVNATVLESEVVWLECEGEGGCDVRPQIIYEYEVDGVATMASRISYPWECVSSERLFQDQQWLVVEDFPVGANVTAYVDPDNREESVLYIGMMGEHDVYSIVQDQFDSTVPFVFISPVLYFVAIRFISPIIRARTSGDSEDGASSTSDVTSYWSGDSPAEQRAKIAGEQSRVNQPNQLEEGGFKPPLTPPSEGGVSQSVPEREEAEGVPFWDDP